jgi:predicted nucleotidyltransferase
MHQGSDHDVHVIFVLRRSEYFGMHEPMQKFSRSYPPTGDMAQVDISGWEARHACRLLSEGNPSVLHVLHSPVEFKTTCWTQLLRETVNRTLNRQLLALAWWKHGRQNFLEYIQRKEEPIRKKYVHVLRPLLSLKWLLQRNAQGTCCTNANKDRMVLPPSGLLDLAQEVHRDGQISNDEFSAVETLISQKDKLPVALPRDRTLDELVKRLTSNSEKQLREWGVPTHSRLPTDAAVAEACSSQWNQVCADMVEKMTNTGQELDT